MLNEKGLEAAMLAYAAEPLINGAASAIRSAIEAYEAAKAAEQPERCKHGVWAADRCEECCKEQPDESLITCLQEAIEALEDEGVHPLDVMLVRFRKAVNAALIEQQSPKRESGKPTEEMCHKARGFIMGLDLGYRTFEEMRSHLSLGGYETLAIIQNSEGHITKWDVAFCIYQLMTANEIEGERK